MARLIQAQGIDFDLTLSSPAVRARQTIDLIKQLAKLRTEVRYDERIYEASGARLLEIIRQIESDRKTVLLVGHNPGLEDLLHLLTGETQRLPTGSLSKITLKISKWLDAGDETATLDWIVRPKELDGS